MPLQGRFDPGNIYTFFQDSSEKETPGGLGQAKYDLSDIKKG